MKKFSLCLLLFFLTGCASHSLPYCEKYENKTDQRITHLTLKDGFVQKNIKEKNKTQSSNGLFTVQENKLTIFIRDKKETFIIENKNLISTYNQQNNFKCH